MAKATRRRRPRGEGTIYETADGRLRGAIVWRDPQTGRQRRRVVSGRTRLEVRERLAMARQELAQGIGGPGGPRTLAAFVEAWLPTLRDRIRPSTWRFYDQDMRAHVLPAIGQLPLADITPGHVERLTAGVIAKGRSATTARGVRTTLGVALRDAQRDGLVARNAAKLARPPRPVRHELRILTADETRRLLAGTTDDELGPLWAVAATTGMRQGELFGLSWHDVDIDGKRPSLTVRRSLARDAAGGFTLAEPKTSRSRRTLELPPSTVAALRSQRDRQRAWREAAGDLWQDQDELVFTDPLGQSLRTWNVGRAFHAALERLGLPSVRMHDLRHGVASLLLAQGVPLKLVSEMLGHSTITITADIYSHLDREQRAAAASAIEAALGGR